MAPSTHPGRPGALLLFGRKVRDGLLPWPRKQTWAVLAMQVITTEEAALLVAPVDYGPHTIPYMLTGSFTPAGLSLRAVSPGQEDLIGDLQPLLEAPVRVAQMLHECEGTLPAVGGRDLSLALVVQQLGCVSVEKRELLADVYTWDDATDRATALRILQHGFEDTVQQLRDLVAAAGLPAQT